MRRALRESRAPKAPRFPSPAMQSGAPLLHPNVQDYRVPDQRIPDIPNTCAWESWRKGDVAVGFAVLPSTAHHRSVANTFLWIAVVLTLVTGAQYLLDGRRTAPAGWGSRSARRPGLGPRPGEGH